MMPLFSRSEEFLCFLKDPTIFPPFATIWAAKIGKVRSPKYIIQRNSEIKEVTNFLKAYLQFHFHQATVSVTNNFFLYCESSIECDSEIIILKWSPPSREIGKKSESVMGREVGQRKMKYLKISCCRVPSQPGNIQHQNVLTS